MVKLFANREDPDQTPHDAASDLGLHCLPVTLLRVSWLQWVKVGFSVVFSVSFCSRWTLKRGFVFITAALFVFIILYKNHWGSTMENGPYHKWGHWRFRLACTFHCIKSTRHKCAWSGSAYAPCWSPLIIDLGPVVQSVVSLTSLLVVKMLTVLVSTIYNSQVFLLKKCE